ncbi:hypothetical protein DH2020_023987 [Rehmannia glutinosa]|uniref:PB1-like domain-containing protein n=1 Tax=Rehmannia glutinosa TaxID=99300 RepID=A0ABR0WBD9_REHGL
MMYYGAEINHIDYCDADEMSLLELHNMAKELTVKEYVRFYYSRFGVDNCSDLVVVENNIDALNLVNCIDHNRMVGVFIEHEKINLYGNESESYHELPRVDEPLEFVGNDRNETENNDVHDNNESIESEGDTEESCNSASDMSDNFIDSDWDISDDDVLFDSYIDEEVEWGGLHMNTSQSSVSSALVAIESNRNRCEGEMYNGNPIFNKRVDGQDPKFELGMLFSDTTMLRQAIRQHAIKNGRDGKNKKVTGDHTDGEEYMQNETDFNTQESAFMPSVEPQAATRVKKKLVGDVASTGIPQAKPVWRPPGSSQNVRFSTKKGSSSKHVVAPEETP